MAHTVGQLVDKIQSEMERAVQDHCYIKNPLSICHDPGLPPGVRDTDDIAKIPDDPPADPRKDSPVHASAASVAKTSPLGQIVEHAITRKWAGEKMLESATITIKPEGLDSLIKAVGRLEERFEEFTKK